MVSKTIPVNTTSERNDNFGPRIVLERERLKFKQVDICLRARVSKTTQIKYESGDRIPDIEYLATLERLGFDVIYILTGERSDSAPMGAELQNLLEAYEASPTELKRAVFGVLLSPYKAEWDKSRVVPGYFRHQILGEEDSRFEEHHAKGLPAAANADRPNDQPLNAEEKALLDNYRNLTPERQAALRETGATLEKPLDGEGDAHCA